ncbi:MAG TPA: amylo-alpha-1,6-glucosidase [Candidatus Polarisedimenticolaceae bacterium]
MSSTRREWLEADGLGGFASGTASGIRTRRYHALLLAAARPPAERFVLVNGLEATVATAAGRFALSSQRYAPGVVHPDGAARIVSFTATPWPRWTFRLEDGTVVEQEIVVPRGAPAVLVRFRASAAAILTIRPLMSGRDFHALQRENGAFRFDAEPAGDGVRFRPYDGVPATRVRSNGIYRPAPDWYRNFEYEEERARGLDFVEDLASPGEWSFDLSTGEAWMLLVAEVPGAERTPEPEAIVELERARCDRAVEAYLVERDRGLTLIAGYPWFGDWGRDTFIAIRGLCLATGRRKEAGAILSAWAGAVSEGMLPNRFPDHGETPEYNSVDASLWYAIAVHEYLASGKTPVRERDRLRKAVGEILEGYARGTRFGIRLDGDGLLASGVPGVQLTWMDAKVGDWVVTPRTGKAVEIQALWLNALRAASAWDPRWTETWRRGSESFVTRFWNPERGYLLDVADVDHVPGRDDASFRPNQILAVGGLPWSLLPQAEARRVVDAVEARLWTPLGPRSLAPGEQGYVPRYAGGVLERDGAYHQGTVWPWLAGPFVEAWVAVRGGTIEARREARARFLEPLLAHLDDAGLGHVSEIADAEAPHEPKGCPFQAWSLGELLRLDRVVLREAA